jgi:hypothetical protein
MTMSNSKDKKARASDADPDKPYAIGNKKPPLHTQFKRGQSGNPSGRPITKGPQSKRTLANEIGRAEAQLAIEAEARKKPEADEPVAKFSWTEAQARWAEELERRAAELELRRGV